MVRGGGTLIVDVLAITAMQRLVSASLVARVFGVFFALVLAATAIGAIVTPPLLAALGLRGVLLLMGLLIPALVLIGLPRLRALDRAGLGTLAVLARRVAVLRQLAIFEGATRPVLERLAAACVEQARADGDVLMHEGDVADALYVLVSGALEVTAGAEAGRPQSLGRLSAPAYAGELGLLGRMPRTATVTCAGPCAVYRIDGEDFLDALTTTPLSPSALGLAQVRLARTYPTRRLPDR